ncbi:MAG: hypothetical protein JWO31_2677 [Phycisphaerales bacterium]|nr:hypothetical protein [Phycisphaerales bacterium]
MHYGTDGRSDCPGAAGRIAFPSHRFAKCVRRRATTLAETLVVIGIIVVAGSMLLVILSAARKLVETLR